MQVKEKRGRASVSFLQKPVAAKVRKSIGCAGESESLDASSAALVGTGVGPQNSLANVRIC